jgi:PAS domain S-box-containing protein
VVTRLAGASASFPPAPVSARDARRFLRAFLADQGADDLVDAAELALSEAVTNAVLHAHTDFDVALSLGGDGQLRVEVTDRNPQLPVQRDYAAQATTGRGMEMIAALTADCGVTTRGTAGKTVWFVVAPDSGDEGPDADDVLAAWDIEPEDTAGPATVVLLELPPTLWLAAREHHDAVLRELALYAAEHPDAAPSAARRALADQARSWISARLIAELDRVAADRAHRALPEGHPSPLPDTPTGLDLHVSVPDGAAEAFAALQDVLDTAERLAATGLLLARPGLPEIVAVRDWAAEQAIAQLSGVDPAPWPGTEHERFVTDSRDHRLAPPDWDTTQVTESDRGMVAADDTNRIIAISGPLATALGWTPADLVGRRIVALIPHALREAHVAGFTRHLTTGQTHVLGVPLRLPVLRRDGTTVECDFLIEQAPATTGRHVYVARIEPGPA